jgi:predicted neuraminidase
MTTILHHTIIDSHIHTHSDEMMVIPRHIAARSNAASIVANFCSFICNAVAAAVVVGFADDDGVSDNDNDNDNDDNARSAFTVERPVNDNDDERAPSSFFVDDDDGDGVLNVDDDDEDGDNTEALSAATNAIASSIS